MPDSFATWWTVVSQAPLPIPRQEYWSGLPLPSQGMFPAQGLNLRFQHWQADSLPLSHWGKYYHITESESVSHSVVSDSVTPWTTAHQAPWSVEFSRQGYWNGLPFPSLGGLSDSRIKPGSPALAGRFLAVWATREAHFRWW